jgi:hypothetical protein
VAQKDDWFGPSAHRGGHRGSGGISSRPSPRPAAARQRSSCLPEFGGALGGSTRRTFQLLFTAAERLHTLLPTPARTLTTLGQCSDFRTFR